ncbi:hypothetical protein [Neorhizobium sp. AL 9.2.2]|uniref:hypothetical protein n=1 Tax=Neorhizobium sp. AL 9.2.2 TaxID=2712894 RepID=UPI001574C57B|nr:hypothetical protein [Neorhizobium sp. AL 9.2.2]NSY19768.1 hypothetical protein [Neorhizobium sp. AL 9.2.2]
MKICIIIPTEDVTQQAGVRIRYNRIEKALAARGDRIRVTSFQAFAQRGDDDDVYIFSKCYDARALVLAHTLKTAGKIIGIDLFDDYFSQSRDSRMARFRHWLGEMTGWMDFILCSTPAMAKVAKALAPALPVHIMNDPAPGLDPDRLKILLRDKIEKARRTRNIEVCWFGIGDNPYFTVGLADLVAFSHKLTELEASGYEVSLAIRTNARALTVDSLSRLRRIPVPYSLQEWSVESEALLIEESLICFIPTTGQNFSTAKSLNRALTALTHGGQVLSVGHPLYAPLYPFIYRRPADLLADLEGDRLALRPQTVDDMGVLINRLGNIGAEAAALSGFLKAHRPQSSPVSVSPAKLAVVHGVRSDDDVNTSATAAGAITVASPYCRDPLSVDVLFRFVAKATRMEVLVCERTMLQLPASLVAGSGLPETVGTRRYRRLSLPANRLEVACALSGRGGSTIEIMAGYGAVLRRIEAVIAHLFPGMTCVFSEKSVFPFAVLTTPNCEVEA